MTKSFTSQILGGLEYLHSKGIIHRVRFPSFLLATLTWQLSQNLKADKILVEEFRLCKISDFGISKKMGDINMLGAHTPMQGSVFWMAPEVIDDQKGYNSKVDIWSVGCVVFEMWAGEGPWNGQDAVAVLMQVCIRLDQLSGSSSLSPLLSSIN